MLTLEALQAQPITSLIPHDYPMVFVDQVLGFSEDTATVQTQVSNKPLMHQGRLPAWSGAEIMAQTIAVLGGIRRLQSSKPVEVGFLVSCRKFKSSVPYFTEGDSLVVHAKEILLSADGLAVFECQIMNEQTPEEPVITATIHVFQPTDDAGLNEIFQ